MTRENDKASPDTPNGKPPQIGDNNTIVNATIPESMGSGNTFVGATDPSGNTILNKGGTAIGAGARADETSIAIGAGALGGKREPEQKP